MHVILQDVDIIISIRFNNGILDVGCYVELILRYHDIHEIFIFKNELHLVTFINNGNIGIGNVLISTPTSPSGI